MAGGDNSVRGYKYESLGPTDDEGIVVGGQQVFSASIEYDHRVAKSWVLDVFVDAGNAYNETMDKMYVGSGFGFDINFYVILPLIDDLGMVLDFDIFLEWPLPDQVGLVAFRIPLFLKSLITHCPTFLRPIT